MLARVESKPRQHPANQLQVQLDYDGDRGVYWAYMQPNPRPCFNVQLLDELNSFIETIRSGFVSQIPHVSRVRYGVLASKTPGVFNLGGVDDLRWNVVQRGKCQRSFELGTAEAGDLSGHPRPAVPRLSAR